jgi:putative membrane protein
MYRTCIALAAMAMAFPAFAQAPRTSSQPQGQVSAATKQFVEKAAVGDLYEIQSSKMALEKSKNNEFQNFARQIVDDHSKSSEELKSMAQGIQGLQVPAQLDAKHKQMISQLQSASGEQFNRTYRDQQTKAHEEAIQLFENYTKSGDNTQLRQFAEKTLPKLQHHLQMAQKLPQETGAPTVGQAPGPKESAAQQKSATQRNQAQPQKEQKQNVIASPSPNHILGSDLRGTTVYGSNNEKVGDVSEIVLSRDGKLVAVIVGVGGFLGIGEKDVAIPFEALEIATAPETTGTGSKQTTGTQPRNQGQERSAQGSGQKAPAKPDRIVLRGMSKQDLQNAPKFQKSNQAR